MKKSTFTAAMFAAIAIMPSAASANYYGYDRCVKNGGGYFGCLGELADVMIAAPEIEEQFGFVKERKDGEDRIMESLKALSGTCDKVEKGEARMSCYAKGLKMDLRAVAVERPAVKASTMSLQSGTKAATVDK